jgi:hypothetical protein
LGRRGWEKIRLSQSRISGRYSHACFAIAGNLVVVGGALGDGIGAPVITISLANAGCARVAQGGNSPACFMAFGAVEYGQKIVCFGGGPNRRCPCGSLFVVELTRPATRLEQTTVQIRNGLKAVGGAVGKMALGVFSRVSVSDGIAEMDISAAQEDVQTEETETPLFEFRENTGNLIDVRLLGLAIALLVVLSLVNIFLVK